MRTWLVTLLLFGIGTAGAMNFWRVRTADEVTDPANDASDPAQHDPPVDSVGDVVEDVVELHLEELASGPSVAASGAQDDAHEDPRAAVAVDDRTAASANEPATPVAVAMPTEPGDEVIDRMGGSVIPAEGEARKRALSLVEQASRCTDPVEQSRLLSQAVLGGALDPVSEAKAYESLLEANPKGVFNPRVPAFCSQVTVAAGDSLWKICRNAQKDGSVGCTPGLVRLVNAMPNDHLRAGAKLKLPNVPISIIVEKPKYRLSVLFGEILLKRYLVGLGKDNKTPEGEFKIKTRLVDPPWFKPGVGEIAPNHPENVLGTRWLGFAEKEGFLEAATFGIHGTREDNSIGTQSSNGCVRMHNAEVEELFEWVGEGTQVVIRG
jgi:hypothetical protein